MGHGASSVDPVVVIGAGPAGLTAALEVVRSGRACTVLESDPEYVGGLARTVRYKDYRLDIGGHRFYTKIDEISRWWREVLPEDFIEVQRRSRIYYRRKFLDYPLKPWDVFRKIGVLDSLLCGWSHVKRKVRPIRPEVSFRDWVVNRFGDRLFRMFFETYTEKVWGIPCSEISADWSAQRIQDLSLTKTVLSALRPRRNGAVAKTLIDRFHYPRLGCGMVWDRTRRLVEEGGGAVHLDHRVTRLEHDGTRVQAVICETGDGETRRFPASSVISSMPLRHLVGAAAPEAPADVRDAADRLRYRDFLTVAVVVSRRDCFPDNWIYIHDPSVKVGRVQNFRNWSADMVPDDAVSVLGLEYFCFDGDELWSAPDAELLDLGAREMERIGLVDADEVVDGTVVRVEKAYPIYDEHYQEALAVIRPWLRSFPNLQSAGRNAMHQYNNQDHSMMAALLAARNVMEVDDRDPWQVNHNAEYLEERSVPRRLDEVRTPETTT